MAQTYSQPPPPPPGRPIPGGPPRAAPGAPPPYRPGPAKPWIKPMVMLIIVVVMLGIAMTMVWWHTEIKIERDREYGDGTAVYSADFKHDEIETKEEYEGELFENETDDEDTKDWDDMGDLDRMEDTFGLTNTFVLITLILAVVALVFVVICGMQFLPFNIAWILCLVTLLVSLIAPIYFATAIGDACKKDDYPGDDGEFEFTDDIKVGPIGFITFDSDSGDYMVVEDAEVTATTYPTVGWFMAIIAIIFCLIAFIMATRLKRVIGPHGYGVPRGPPPGYSPPPPPSGAQPSGYPPAPPGYGPPPGRPGY